VIRVLSRGGRDSRKSRWIWKGKEKVSASASCLLESVCRSVFYEIHVPSGLQRLVSSLDPSEMQKVPPPASSLAARPRASLAATTKAESTHATNTLPPHLEVDRTRQPTARTWRSTRKGHAGACARPARRIASRDYQYVHFHCSGARSSYRDYSCGRLA
jgi:hypothetical protein